MARFRSSKATSVPPIFFDCPCAIDILAKAASCSRDDALEGLRALLSAGFVVAPRVPTNNMVAAYIDAYGMKPQTSHSMIRAIMKAKLRWSAMATEGCKVAASRKHMGEIETEMFGESIMEGC